MSKTPVNISFVVDCPECKAKVGAIEKGRAEDTGWNDYAGEPYGQRILIGACPVCSTLLVGHSWQIDFAGVYGEEEDRWSDVVRVFPKPPKAFSSYRIPKALKQSLLEADRSMQAGANIAACVMLGRALEALCRDALGNDGAATGKTGGAKRPLMLGKGIQTLRDKKIIDDRLFDWSQQLHAFRNLAAHPEDISITRQDAEDLQAFVYAITEYVYDLADRYDEFKVRLQKQQERERKQAADPS